MLGGTWLRLRVGIKQARLLRAGYTTYNIYKNVYLALRSPSARLIYAESAVTKALKGLSPDVRAALAAVESEAAPAGIVYRTDAAIAKKTLRAKVAFEVTNGPRITYVVAPLANAKNRPAAEAFVKFLRGAASRAEFEKHGFLFLAKN